MTKKEELEARYGEVILEINELSTKLPSCSKDDSDSSCGILMSQRSSLSLEASELKDAIRRESRK